MGLSFLSDEQILHLTQGWLDSATDAGAILHGNASTAMHLPLVAELRSMLSQSPSTDPRLLELREAVGRTDDEHDHRARGIYAGLEAAVQLFSAVLDEASADEARRIRALLFPKGLRVTMLSYEEEAGAAAARAEVYTPAVRDFLSKIVVGPGHLADAVDAWNAAGLRIGELLVERATLAKEVGSPTAEAIYKAGQRIRKLIRTMESSLRFGSADDADTIMKPILAAVQEARAARRSTKKPEELEVIDR